MFTKLNLETEANKLAEKVNLDDKFQLEYIIPNIDEQTLLDEGFYYVGKSEYTKCPLYQKENLYGLFLGNSFRLGEGTFISEEEYRKIEEENNKEKEIQK